MVSDKQKKIWRDIRKLEDKREEIINSMIEEVKKIDNEIEKLKKK